MIRVYISGRHAHRMPLSYPALRPLFEDQITRVMRPEQADLYLFAHPGDVADAARALVEDWRRRRRPVVVLSEEPFWDTIWGQRPCDPLIYVDSAFGTLPVHQINFQTSDVFAFDRIPYYLLTNHRFANAYAARFARGVMREARDWAQDWAARPMDLSFMFERRPEPYHWVHWPQGDVTGLCSWRTELAEACDWGADGPKVERLGRSWGTGLSRFDLRTDWHLNKLARMDGRARLMGALENTHQPQYLTEKLFDAFACGARPIYYAAPRHRIHDLGLPPDSWLNLYGKSPQEAAIVVKQSLNAPDPCAMVAAQKCLFDLMSDAAAWQSERRRLAHALPAALVQILAGVPEGG